MVDLSVRANESELMDDLTRPDSEFDQAYKELAVINRRLGGIRAIERFLPAGENLRILDVAAGGCDIGEALAEHRRCTVVSLDLNPRGLRYCRRSAPVVADALTLPFASNAFDVVTCSLSFHHLTDDQCVRVLREMWRTARNLVLVNDLHRHPIAHASIVVLSRLFSKSVMVRHDGPASVRRAFSPRDLQAIANGAGVPARVYRSFPYRLVLVARKREPQ
jgi:ubiquinone/menaquinone biosynthesis C-methylase UbiE